jgi:hypothetical protein
MVSLGLLATDALLDDSHWMGFGERVFLYCLGMGESVEHSLSYLHVRVFLLHGIGIF